jgi:hypothetical protein
VYNCNDHAGPWVLYDDDCSGDDAHTRSTYFYPSVSTNGDACHVSLRPSLSLCTNPMQTNVAADGDTTPIGSQSDTDMEAL